MKIFILSLFLITCFYYQSATAEVWYANRMAQNCAGCHAPGRLNQPPKGRRCTLSCQGCHVNPNGGGLRNQYGSWAQKRWLRSLSSATLQTLPSPLPHNKQPYIKRKTNKRLPILKTRYSKKLDIDESLYSNKVYKDWHADATSVNAFLNRIPKDDPYRKERNRTFTTSGDFRYLLGNQSGNVLGSNAAGAEIPGDKELLTFPMSFDIGLRVRPTKENYSFVFEARFLNGPNNKDLADLFSASAIARSAYFLADDLAYNTWVMAGIYRPMFGHYTPDHTNLSQSITGLGQNLRYKAIGIGTAPNVPLANVHAIQSVSSADDESGLVGNIGARFVTMGASVRLSVLRTTKGVANGPETIPVTKSIVALSGGMSKGKNTLNIEATAFNIEDQPNVVNAGSVYNFEYKRRLWRENYFIFNYGFANTASDRTEGTSSEIMIGEKSFLWPGVEVEGLYIKRFETLTAADKTNSQDTIQVQLHLFF